MHSLSKRILASNSQRKGFALVLVLAFLVIITAIVLAFIVSVKGNLLLASGFENGANAKILSDVAIQHAIGTLRQATCPATTSTSWASQPGMIRNFDASGNFTLYKLYTSDTPVVTGTSSLLFDPTLDYGLGTWSANPELFTDLNAPVLNSGGSTVYPIVDPAASTAPVQGFSYSSSNTATGTGANPVPMPVKWIYVLQDGTLTTPTTGSNGTASWTGAGAPTASNPITGRFAYWTDDETSKLNINTASEGTFWERPVANTTQEQLLANSAPISNEFQRYDGHPAKTSLDPVLGSVLPVPNPAIPTSNFTKLEPYYNIVPRIAYSTANLGGTIPQIQCTTTVGLDGDRLYSALDELVFSQPSSATQTFNPPLAASTTLTPDFLRKTKFFLTTNSRSSDLNLFGKPRVCLWPLQQATADRTTTDNLIAFCSTLGTPTASGNPYYFQRATVWGDSGYPGAIGLLPVTPMTTGSAFSPSTDWAITRNANLYTYLQNLTSQAIPGYGAALTNKYTTSNRDQILTEMVDYMRSGFNIFDSTPNPTAANPNYSYAFVHNPQDSGYAEILPLNATATTKGFGRLPTVSEATLVIYRSDNDGGSVPSAPSIRSILLFKLFNPVAGFPGINPNFIIAVKNLDKITLSIDGGLPANNKTLSPLNGLNLLTAQGLKGPRMEVFAVSQNQGDYNAEAGFSSFPLLFGMNHGGQFNDPRADWYNTQGNTIFSTTAQLTQSQATGKANYYPFISQPVAIGSGTKFSTTASPTASPVQIILYSPNDPTLTSPIQTINVLFPAITSQPIPTVLSSTTPPLWKTDINSRLNFGQLMGYGPPPYLGANGGCIGPDVISNQPIIENGDTVLSMVAGSGQPGDPSKGDLRVMAALANVPPSFFSEVPGSGVPSGAHELRSGSINAGVGGKLVASASYNGLAGYTGSYPTIGTNSSNGRQPTVSPEINGALNSSSKPGDWDSGIGYLEDGPYINFPDQGNIYKTDSNQGGAMVSVYFDPTFLNMLFGWVYFSANGAAWSYAPNRQVPSAVMFGSLPTGIDPLSAASQPPSVTAAAYAPVIKPWQTLLFCPNPAAGFTSAEHYGFTNPPDHLFLDLFTMPIVQPYALSEPTSTQGRVNLNFNIMPFNYITRSTALYGVLNSVMLTAIPSTDAATYKAYSPSSSTYRYNLDLDKTISGFTAKFSGTDYTQNFFRSASEVCTMPLVPTGYNLSDVQSGGTFWSTHGDLTGDNAREAPYNDIYPRVTTKSNSYTVYYRVQVVKQTPADITAGIWVENRDQILSESRGSALIERYIDPADPRLLPNSSTGTFDENFFGATTYNSNGTIAKTGTLEPLNKFHVVSSTTFAP